MCSQLDADESPWQQREKRPYVRTVAPRQDPEYVRIYASQQDISGYNDESNCIGHSVQYGRPYSSTCDIFNGVDQRQRPQPQQRAPGRDHQGRPTPMTPDVVTMVTTSNRPRYYSEARSPVHVTLTVPGNSCRRLSGQSNGAADDVSCGFPSTYPAQPSINGSMSCLNANVPLSHIDFWPTCRKKALMACDATFESFDVLVNKANKWLRQFYTYELVSCETVDKKVIYVKDIYSAAMYFMDEDGPILATHIKGLRIWYRNSPGSNTKSIPELGFSDFVPRYLNPGEKHPRFETLPETLDKINTKLIQQGLPGRIICTESVCLKISREDWSDNIQIDPCSCQWYDEYNMHHLTFIRLYYLKEHTISINQVIGVLDFTPDALDEGGIFHPAKYTPFSQLFTKAAEWIKNNPSVHVTNIQSVDTKHRKRSENHGHRFNTEKMFEYRIEERFRAFFVRIGYVLYTNASPPGAPPSPPNLQCRTYLPYKKTTGYENITEILQRVDIAIRDTGARVYHVETVPMPEWITKPELCEKGERTFFDGEWYFVADQDGNERGPYRYTLIYAVRVYYEDLPPDYDVPHKPSTKKRHCCFIL